MADVKNVELVRRLLQRSQNGRVRWERTSREGVYQTDFTNYVVVLSKKDRPNEMGQLVTDYFLDIADDTGQLVDRFSDVDLSAATSSPNERNAMFSLMRELYDIARRDAMGVDKAITSIIKDLGED